MNSKDTKLLDLLSNNDVTFYIPPYQRNYEWAIEQCEVFYDDLIKTYNRNTHGEPSEHFFGVFTYFQSETAFGQPNQIVLIDGQQRITTTMLFLAALRDTVTNEQLKTFIDSKYLRNNNVKSDNDEYKIKLKQVESDWAAYKKIILNEEVNELEEETAVYINYQYFIKRLEDYKDDEQAQVRLIEKGLNCFRVISAQLNPETNKWENPQEIFESMNSLGKPLSLADLVRNYLLLGLDADTQNELYQKYWLHIEQTIPGEISNYIRDYMQWHTQSSYKKATVGNYKELYRRFKDIFDGIDSEVIMKQLARYADVYSLILYHKDTDSKEIDYVLKDIRLLHITTAYSFLMGILARWQDGGFTNLELAEVLDAFRIYCIRRRLMRLTSGENILFPSLVNRINELVQSDNKKQKMFEILASLESSIRLPNDIELAKYLESADFYNSQYCKFALTLIEEKMAKNRPNDSNEKIQIEHIMPQKLTKEWKKQFRSNSNIHQQLVNTIGNLTIIRNDQALGDMPFADKKQIYASEAGLQISRAEVINQDKWNKAAIINRTHWIVQYLLQYVLPIPEPMRMSNNFATRRTSGFSFNELGLVGKHIRFVYDKSLVAIVRTDKEVEFEGRYWKLTPLTKELCNRLNRANSSGSYSMKYYWEYKGKKLAYLNNQGY